MWAAHVQPDQKKACVQTQRKARVQPDPMFSQPDTKRLAKQTQAASHSIQLLDAICIGTLI
jgi:hypothetical protein